MLISTSFLSSKNVVKDIKTLNDTDTDFIHLDIMDGKFVKNKTMPFREMKNIYKYTSKRLDVHLMVKKPEKYIPLYATLNTEYIVFHVETDSNIVENLEQIKSYSIKAGLAISPQTKIKELVPYLPHLDIILIMSVEPGAGGQEFLMETKDRIEELKVLLREYKSKAIISVDGGIDEKTKKYCKNANMLVSGSYVVCSDDFQEKIASLR